MEIPISIKHCIDNNLTIGQIRSFSIGKPTSNVGEGRGNGHPFLPPSFLEISKSPPFIKSYEPKRQIKEVKRTDSLNISPLPLYLNYTRVKNARDNLNWEKAMKELNIQNLNKEQEVKNGTDKRNRQVA